MKHETRTLGTLIILGMLTLTAGSLKSQQLLPVVEEPATTPITNIAEPLIAAREAHARITAPVPTTVLRKERPLTDDYTVSAIFRATDAAVRGEYGLVVGGRAATAVACVARTDGTFAVHRGPIASLDSSLWAKGDTVKATAVTADDHLTIRVAAGVATCTINGRQVASVTAAPGQLDGVPGVYVGPGSSVDVIGWRSESVVPLVTVPADPHR